MRKIICLLIFAPAMPALCIANAVADVPDLLDIDEYWTAADVEAAIRAGADVDARDKKGRTTLMRTVTLPAKEIVETLIAAGTDGMMALLYSADNPKQKYLTDRNGGVVMKLGTGDQKIRISAEGYKVKETTLLNVPRGGESYNVALELL